MTDFQSQIDSLRFELTIAAQRLDEWGDVTGADSIKRAFEKLAMLEKFYQDLKAMALDKIGQDSCAFCGKQMEDDDYRQVSLHDYHVVCATHRNAADVFNMELYREMAKINSTQ